jgi:hypothetical protein
MYRFVLVSGISDFWMGTRGLQASKVEAIYQIVMGNCYWLVWHKRFEKNLLVHTGPSEWATGIPEDYQYLMQVKYMGDHTWQEVIS